LTFFSFFFLLLHPKNLQRKLQRKLQRTFLANNKQTYFANKQTNKLTLLTSNQTTSFKTTQIYTYTTNKVIMSSLKTSKHVSEQFVQWCELGEHLLIILRQKEENLTLALTINHQESQEEHIEWYQRMQICALIDDEQHFLAEQALNRERSRRTYYAKLTQAGLVRCQKNIERIEN